MQPKSQAKKQEKPTVKYQNSENGYLRKIIQSRVHNTQDLKWNTLNVRDKIKRSQRNFSAFEKK